MLAVLAIVLAGIAIVISLVAVWQSQESLDIERSRRAEEVAAGMRAEVTAIEVESAGPGVDVALINDGPADANQVRLDLRPESPPEDLKSLFLQALPTGDQSATVTLPYWSAKRRWTGVLRWEDSAPRVKRASFVIRPEGQREDT